MKRLLALTTAASLLATTALAASPPERIRGTLVSATETGLTLKLADGQTEMVGLSSTTHFIAATPSSLSAVQSGGYIGTATKMVNGKNIALEVVVFPPAMRGTGDGHYAWDTINDTTVPTGGATHSSMTNGSVSSAMPVMAPKTGSSMTNGSVQTASSAGGEKQLVVAYKGGEQTILVPATAPVVTVAPATRAVLTAGAPVVLFASPMQSGPMAIAVMVGTHGAKMAM